VKTLYGSVTGTTGLLSINVSNGHSTQMANATIECRSTSLDIGDDITVDLGYTDDHGLVFTGYVKVIEEQGKPNSITITASDELVRAADFFIVTTNPTTPLKVQNKSPEDIIEQLLDLAGISDFEYDSSSYVWGVAGAITIDCVSVYDYSKMLADLIAWQFWADETGTVMFKDRRPYPMGGDSSIGTIWDNEIITIKDWKNDRSLRNKVVFWGATGIYAEASDPDCPYVPDGFFKTAVASSPIIDDQDMAQLACDFNLEVYNRLARGYTATIIGDHGYNSRRVCHLDRTNEDVYIFSAEHSWGKSGYVTNLELRKE
jgi:hypothetical protein